MIGIISSSILYDMYKVLPLVTTDAFDISQHCFVSTLTPVNSYSPVSSSQETTCSIDSVYPGTPSQDVYYSSSDEYEDVGDFQFRAGVYYDGASQVRKPDRLQFLSYIKHSTIGDQVSPEQVSYVRELPSLGPRHNSSKNGGIQVL